MNEQQIEALDKMFPEGYVIITKPSANKVHFREHNPKGALVLNRAYEAAHAAWRELEREVKDEDNFWRRAIDLPESDTPEEPEEP